MINYEALHSSATDKSLNYSDSLKLEQAVVYVSIGMCACVCVPLCMQICVKCVCKYMQVCVCV